MSSRHSRSKADSVPSKSYVWGLAKAETASLLSPTPANTVIMVIGSLEVRLLIRESRTLKDKRQVVRSILERLRNGFNVSATEVDSHQDVKVATLAFAVVGFEIAAVQHTLQQIAEALRKHPVAEYLNGESVVGREVV